jgi:uncharacterized protein (TIGR02421 family)
VRDELARAVRLLRDAERPVRVLRTVAWAPEVRERFFAAGARELPAPGYQPLDAAPTLEQVAAARALADGDDPVAALLRRAARAIELGARMLAAVGTADLHAYAAELYGAPTMPLADQASTSLELARTFESTLSAALAGGPAPAAEQSAEEVAAAVERAVGRAFGADAPRVELVDHLSANALAGPGAIRIRRGARFTDRDAAQLVQHEAFVHIATTLSGRAQEALPLLAAGHPGTTRTQEGLAVFAEFISGAIDPDRLQRLADRVLAIQMAIDGADFLDVYRWFVEQTGGDREQAFENARRVFRGGVLAGGAPFTKDVVYLDGLLRVHNFLRSAVAAGRADCIHLLFVGKLDIEDVPALCHLAAEGALAPPRFVPPWAADRRFLVAYLAYSGFLNQVDLDAIRRHYEGLLAEAPRVIDSVGDVRYKQPLQGA